jgi:hypothetical protein
MAEPRLVDFAQRLSMARHDAAVEDLLDGSPPRLLLSLRPWRGPWTDELSPPQGTLELALEAGPEGQVAVRMWLDANPEADEPTEMVRLAPARLSAAWLEGLTLDFVGRLLARA